MKLAARIGLLTGWFGWAYVVLATVTSFVVASWAALVMLATRRASLKDRLPLGPTMVLGALVAAVTAVVRLVGY